MKKSVLLILLYVCANSLLLAQTAEEKVTREDIQQEEAEQAPDPITDDAIVYPESMRENLSDLLRAWQLDLSKAEMECSRGQNIVYHDTVYMNRLYRLPTEMELSYNQVVRKHIDMYANRRREQVSYMLELGNYYFPCSRQRSTGMDYPRAEVPPRDRVGPNPSRSPVGATGLWQFMLRTGKGYGLEVNSLVDERRDPYKATKRPSST